MKETLQRQANATNSLLASFKKSPPDVRARLLKCICYFIWTLTIIGCGAMDSKEQSNARQLTSPYGPLNDLEREVIVNKGTERPGSGKYTNTTQPGIYACRNCGSPLFAADDKFLSQCGWPAFDDMIPGQVKSSPDADGRRTEITCARCAGHLGHVFSGERLTAKNTRHCVNSVAIVLEGADSQRVRQAVFAGGCFWGVEALLEKQPGVLAAVSGYTGGTLEYPSYKQVCAGNTGHAEAVQVFYNPKQIDFLSLCQYFLEIHDPTQEARQGPDVGQQYRSAIFYRDDEQQRIAAALLQLLKRKGLEVQTDLEPLGRFWNAEQYHQDYYAGNGKTPYCHAWQKRFDAAEITTLAAELSIPARVNADATDSPAEKAASIYDFSVKTAADSDESLSKYKGKVLLIVNTASKCGFTPQYEGLEELYQKYREQGLVVLGFPCNQFKSQEPGSNADIQEFCRLNYGVSFPVYAKIDVNGDNTHPLYKFLKVQKSGLFSQAIKWNFSKFLVGADGLVIDRYAPTTKPASIAADIEKALQAVVAR